MTRAAPLTLALGLIALPLRAEPLQGELRLGAVDTDTGTEATVFADFDWQYRLGSGGLAFGSYGVWTEDTHPHETYATLFVDLGGGQLSAGVPRPAYDQFAVAAVDHAFPSLGISFVGSTRSHATAVAADGAGVPLGLMYRAGADDLGWAVSAHDIDRTDTQLLSFGAGFAVQDWQFSVATEWVDGPGDSDLNAKIQGGTALGSAWLSASYFTAGAQDAPDLAELAATLPVNDRLSATLFSVLPTEDLDDSYLGAAARYTLGRHVVLDAAAAHGDGDTWLGASVGLQF
ncbi:hypothetical protein [Actibacterium ureilyticum]|uniref:hypothetical protein n=1 Tax=Actibacterium ureilyticum TaxID=1590614 RepID=UPI0011409BBA|nr:hypothetical protein [Actibacterium ureilyticum]